MAVPQRVGQRLLHDPVRRQLHPAGQFLGAVVPAHRHPQADRPDGVGQGVELREAGLRTVRVGAVVGGQGVQHGPQFGERGPGGRADRTERGPGPLRLLVEDVLGGRGLHRDDRHVVGHHVVQFAGDPLPLPGEHLPLPVPPPVRASPLQLAERPAEAHRGHREQ